MTDYKTMYECLCTYTRALTEDYNELNEENRQLRFLLTDNVSGGIIEKRYDPNQPRDKKGRWSSSGGSENIDEKHHFEKVTDIDISDKNEVNKVLFEFEEKYRDSDIEHCRVITSSGEVYDVHGGKYNVNTELLGDKMNGSINKHNHVKGESEYSFSREDFCNSAADGSYISMAFDEKYRYEMIFDKPISYEKAYNAFENAKEDVFNNIISGKHISSENLQHEIINTACTELDIFYRRTEL